MGNLTQTAAFQKELLKLRREDQFRVYETLTKLQRDSRAPGLQIKRMERVDLWEFACRATSASSQNSRTTTSSAIASGITTRHCAGPSGCQESRMRNVPQFDAAPDARTSGELRNERRNGEEDEAKRPARDNRGRCSRPEIRGARRMVRNAAFVYDAGPSVRERPRCVHARSGVLVALELYARPNHESTGANPVYRVPSEAIARAFVAGEIADLEFNLPASSWSIVRSARKAPIFVKGGPGSGKTLVALYRALHVIEEPALALVGPPRVLYITYTRQLRDDARNKVERLRGSITASLEIETFDAIGERLVPGARTKYDFSTLERAARAALGDAAVDPAFFLEEVAECIERRNVRSLDDYARLVRRGRVGGYFPASGRRFGLRTNGTSASWLARARGMSERCECKPQTALPRLPTPIATTSSSSTKFKTCRGRCWRSPLCSRAELVARNT